MNTQILISFLKIKRISSVENDVAVSYEEIHINYRFVRNIVINKETINILYQLNHNSIVLYKISIDNGEYLPLQEIIDGVLTVRCYVSYEEYRKIKSAIADFTY
jgi:hypothetical protein